MKYRLAEGSYRQSGQASMISPASTIAGERLRSPRRARHYEFILRHGERATPKHGHNQPMI